MEEMLVNLNCVMFLLTYIYAVLRHIYVLIYCCTHFNFLILILNWCDLLWLKCGVLLELPFILFGEWQQIRFLSCRKLRMALVQPASFCGNYFRFGRVPPPALGLIQANIAGVRFL